MCHEDDVDLVVYRTQLSPLKPRNDRVTNVQHRNFRYPQWRIKQIYKQIGTDV